MNNKKKNNDEKKFRNDIDRLIAGEKRKSEDTSDADYEKNVKFAGKMLKSRVEPSPEFKASLKQRLLLKLENEEIEAERKKEKPPGFWEFVKNFVPKNPVWRTVAVTVTVFVIAFIVVWQTGIFPGQNNPPILGLTSPPTTVTQSLVTVQATAAQNKYRTGEPVEVTLTFENKSREPVTLTPFPPTMMIAAVSLKPYKTIPGGESRTLSPGEVLEYTFSWDQRDDEGLPVPTGDYVIQMLDIELGGGNSPVTLSASPQISIVAP